MIDILHEMSLLSNALQARGTGFFRAEDLMKRSIKVFELLKDNMERYEKEIDERVAFDALKKIQFIENHKFASLPRQMLLDAIIKNMKKRLVADVLLLFNLLNQTPGIWKKPLYCGLQQNIKLANLMNFYIMKRVLMIQRFC